MTQQQPQADRLPAPTSAPSRRRWLLFIHQLPSQPSNLRVTTWRRLQQIGAIPLKQAVYALPDTADAREDFEWLKTEVKAAGGDATVFAADNVDAWSDDALVEEFRRARQEHVRRAGARRRTGVEASEQRSATEGHAGASPASAARHFSGAVGRGREDRLLRQCGPRSCPHHASSTRGPNRRSESTVGSSRNGLLWEDGVVSRAPLDHAASAGRRPHGFGLADSALH